MARQFGRPAVEDAQTLLGDREEQGGERCPVGGVLVPALHLTFLSSSLVREVASLGGDVSDLVHPAVQRALGKKLP